jgi:hypothetical protein
MTTKTNIEAVNSGQTEREALEWTAGTLQSIVSGKWRDVKEQDRVSIGGVVKTISQVLDMADAALARAASTGPATGDREIWEYSFIHSSALGRPDEKVTLLTYDKDTAFKSTCFDQKLVCSAGVAIAEVCQDADGFKHIAEIVEELDDIPTGTRLYAYSVAGQSPAPASPSGEDAAEQSAAPMARSGEQREALDDAYEKGYVDGWKNGPFRRAAPTAKQCAVPSVGAHLWMPAEIPEPLEAPQDFGDRKAYAFKDPKAGEHAPWYVVLPNMNAVKLGYHADDTTDKAHAEFIASAINRAMALPPAIKQALNRFGESQFHCGHDQATSEFKNFHRLLCERFGYVHDERNWQRDQLSLIEWIASDLPRASEQADEAVTDGVAHFNWLCSLMPEGFHWGEPLTPDVLDHIAIAARAKEPK